MTVDVDFANKTVKRHLEEENRKCVKETGGWFGLTGILVEAHWDAWKSMLKARSPFIIGETDPDSFEEIKHRISGLTYHDPKKAYNIWAQFEDIFDCLSRVEPAEVNLFRYGHLDFCRTSKVLVREHKLIEKLYWLSRWNNLKSPFYLDVTFSVRGDGGEYRMYTCMMESMIPTIFNNAGWEVINPKRHLLGHRFVNEYREPHQSPMVNAIYKFVKEQP